MLKNTDFDISELNKEQQKAVLRPINTFTKIVAGAGTGKTKIISKRFVKLFLDMYNAKIENPLDRLLVITFTQKAAAHMKEKIFGELNKKNADYRGQEDWISTIHGFCSKILKKHALEVGLSSSFQLCDEKKTREIYDTIVKRIINYEINTLPYVDDIFKKLNTEKNIFDKNNLLKLKTIDNIHAIFDGIYEIIKQIKSLGLTPKDFLEKSLGASNAFSQAVSSLELGFSTKEEYQRSWQNSLNMYADNSCEFDETVFKDLFASGIIIDKNNARGKNAAQQWTPTSGFPENIPKINASEEYLTKIIAVVYEIFQKELELNDFIDFDDLINKALFLFDNNEIIREYYKKHFKHIIVDEFQDTSTAQMKLILALMSDEKPNLTIVGDRKQSIYGFRYARMENIDVIQKIIEKKYSEKYEEIKLETNYRSTPYILEAVNFVTEHALNLNEGLCANPTKNYTRNGIDFKITQISDYKDTYDLKKLESKYIANEIINVKEKEKLNFTDFAVLVKSHAQADTLDKILSSYGIPCVKKVSCSYFKKEVVKNALAMLEFSSDIRNELAFVKIMEINFSQKEIYNFKKFLDTFLVNNFEKTEYEDLNFAQKALFVYEYDEFKNLNIDDKLKFFLKQLFDTVFEITQNKKSMTLHEIYLKLRNTINPAKGLINDAKNLAEIDLEIFEKIIMDYMKNQNYVSLKNFIEYTDTIREDKSFELPQVSTTSVNAVQILTIYASKGLEFPYVFVAGLKKTKESSSSTPLAFELNESQTGGFGLMIKSFNGKESPKYRVFKSIYTKPRRKNEDLRIFYVALSRAEKYLNLLTFEKSSNSVPANYVSDCTLYFKDYLNNINPNELEIKALPRKTLKSKSALAECPTYHTNITKTTNIEISFSKINTFNQCQKKFLYKYIYKYPEIANIQDYSLIGTLVHNFIYSSFIKQNILSNDETENQINNINIPEQEKQRLVMLINQFNQSRFARLINKDIFCEYGFDFVYQDIHIKGDIDLIIDNGDKTFDIIDFKTNKNIEHSLNDYYKQMFIYKKALEYQNFKIKNIIIVNLKTDEINEIILTNDNLSEAQKAIDTDIQNIKIILHNKESAKTDKTTCESCGFRYLCKN